MAKQAARGVTKHKLESVFTPSAPATLTFVERSKHHRLVEAFMREHARPLCVEGPFQSGKTTLAIRVATSVYPNGPLHVVCNPNSTVDTIIHTAFQILRPYYDSEIVRDKSSVPAGFMKQTFGFGTETAAAGDVVARSTPIAEEMQTSTVLAMYAADAARPLIVDDAHKLQEHEQARLASMVREWQAQATDYGYPKIVIVASNVGAPSMTRSLLRHSTDLANRLASVRLPMMSPDELRSIIRRGAELLNVDFSEIEGNIIALNSGRSTDGGGRPGYVHDLCRHACSQAGVFETQSVRRVISREELEAALEVWALSCAENISVKFEEFLGRVPQGTYAGFCDKVCALVLQSGLEGIPVQQLELSLAEVFSIPLQQCRKALQEITNADEEVITLDQARGLVRFSEPIYMVWYDKTRLMGLDYFAEQDLAKQFLEIVKSQTDRC